MRQSKFQPLTGFPRNFRYPCHDATPRLVKVQHAIAVCVAAMEHLWLWRDADDSNPLKPGLSDKAPMMVHVHPPRLFQPRVHSWIRQRLPEVRPSFPGSLRRTPQWSTWQWNISIHGGFNGRIGRIVYKWWIFHCHVWLPEGRSYGVLSEASAMQLQARETHGAHHFWGYMTDMTCISIKRLKTRISKNSVPQYPLPM